MTESAGKQNLRKHERLHEKTAVDHVFEKGKLINNPPIKLRWVKDARKSNVPVKVAFSVPKKLFKKAATRNLLKRRMREAYRKNKVLKISPANTYSFMFIYSVRKINPYPEIESKIVLTLQHFKTAIVAE